MNKAAIYAKYNISEDYPETFNESDANFDLSVLPEADPAQETKSGAASASVNTSRYVLLNQLVGGNKHSRHAITDDEADPLGFSASVMTQLRKKGVDCSASPAVANQYFISSRDFNPRVFLRDVHADASFDTLAQSLDHLEASITEQSSALQTLVDRNFDKFVKSKSYLDSVFKQFKSSGFTLDNEWGMGELTQSLDEGNSKAAILMNPVFNTRLKEERLQAALEMVTANRYLFELPSTIRAHIKAADHDSLMRDYRRGKETKNERLAQAEQLGDRTTVHMTERMWNDVEDIIEEYEKSCWTKLEAAPAGSHIPSISRLLELQVTSNPVVYWVKHRASVIQQDIVSTCEKLMLSISIARTEILALPENNTLWVENIIEEVRGQPCAPPSTKMWITIKKFVVDMNALCARIEALWKGTRDFIDGIAQQQLPPSEHLKFSEVDARTLYASIGGLVDLAAQQIGEFFTQKPKVMSSTKLDAVEVDAGAENFQETWKRFGFLPPHSNALTTCKYLPQLVLDLAVSCGNIVNTRIPGQNVDTLRHVLDLARTRSVEALCAVWKDDTSKFELLENWKPSRKQGKGHVTHVPQTVFEYQKLVLAGLKKVLFLNTSEQGQRDVQVVLPPAPKLLQALQTYFLSTNLMIVDSLTKLVSGEEHSKPDAQLQQLASRLKGEMDATDYISVQTSPLPADTKILWVVSNLGELKTNVIPPLVKQFQKQFNTQVKFDYDALTQSEQKLFTTYTAPKKAALTAVIKEGIQGNKERWPSNTNPTDISNYIYESLLLLVVVHAQLMSISPQLVSPVIHALQQHALEALLEAVREVELFGPGGMYQAVADIEFFRTIMASYNTNNVQNVVQLIYQAIQQSSGDQSAWTGRHGPWEKVQKLVGECATRTFVCFSCFRN
ncbi:Exocyst complex component SEC5 [Yarrowia sp. B02]|nr:Exocyst complex component SEC5 [Yarrowia sp. B02]